MFCWSQFHSLFCWSQFHSLFCWSHWWLSQWLPLSCCWLSPCCWFSVFFNSFCVFFILFSTFCFLSSIFSCLICSLILSLLRFSISFCHNLSIIGHNISFFFLILSLFDTFMSTISSRWGIKLSNSFCTSSSTIGFSVKSSGNSAFNQWYNTSFQNWSNLRTGYFVSLQTESNTSWTLKSFDHESEEPHISLYKFSNHIFLALHFAICFFHI